MTQIRVLIRMRNLLKCFLMRWNLTFWFLYTPLLLCCHDFDVTFICKNHSILVQLLYCILLRFVSNLLYTAVFFTIARNCTLSFFISENFMKSILKLKLCLFHSDIRELKCLLSFQVLQSGRSKYHLPVPFHINGYRRLSPSILEKMKEAIFKKNINALMKFLLIKKKCD